MLYLLKETDFSPAERNDEIALQSKHFQHLEVSRLIEQFDAPGLTVGDVGPKNWFHSLLSFKKAARRCIVDPYNDAPGGGLEDIPQLPYPIVLFRCLIGPNSDIIPNEFFDVTFSISVIEHIGQAETAFDCTPLATPDPVQDAMRNDFAADLFRITKPGGITFHTIDHAARNLSWLGNFQRAGFQLLDTSIPVPSVYECLNDPDAVRQRVGWTKRDKPMPAEEQALHGVLVGAWRRPEAQDS